MDVLHAHIFAETRPAQQTLNRESTAEMVLSSLNVLFCCTRIAEVGMRPTGATMADQLLVLSFSSG